MSPHPISEFCASVGAGAMSYLCMTQLAGIDPLPVMSGAVGTFIALRMRDAPTPSGKSLMIMFSGTALSAVGGVFVTTLARGWWPDVPGVTLALLAGFVLGFASVGTLPEIAKRAGEWVGNWLGKKSEGQ